MSRRSSASYYAQLERPISWCQNKCGRRNARWSKKDNRCLCKECRKTLRAATIESPGERIKKETNTKALISALKALIPIVRQNLEDQGGCDHSVGICACADIKALEQAESALKKLQ